MYGNPYGSGGIGTGFGDINFGKTLNIIIAGSRNFNDYMFLHTQMNKLLKEKNLEEVKIISGTADGADKLGEKYAESLGINFVRMPADWVHKGKSAGYLRNVQMAEIADYCVVFYDGKSKGSKHMIDICKKKKVPCLVFNTLTGKGTRYKNE